MERRAPLHEASQLVITTTVLASLLSKLVQVSLGQQPWTGFSQTHEVTAGQRSILAVFAGVTEEPLNVGIVVGVIYLSIRLWQVKRSRHGGVLGRYEERQLWRRAVLCAVPVSLFLRFAGHMYQGWVLAAAAALWGAVLLLVFWWVRSIWPLMLAHVLHNMPMGIETWTQYGIWVVGLPAAILAAGVLMLHRGRRGREADRSSQAR